MYYDSMTPLEIFQELKDDLKACTTLIEDAETQNADLKKAVKKELKVFKKMVTLDNSSVGNKLLHRLIENGYPIGSIEEQSPNSLFFIHKVYSMIQGSNGEPCNNMLESLLQISKLFVRDTKALKKREKSLLNHIDSYNKKIANKNENIEKFTAYFSQVKTPPENQKDQYFENKKKMNELIASKQEYLEKSQKTGASLVEIQAFIKHFEDSHQDPTQNAQRLADFDRFSFDLMGLIHFMEMKKTRADLNEKVKIFLGQVSLKLVVTFFREDGSKETYEGSGFLVAAKMPPLVTYKTTLTMTHFVTALHCFAYPEEELRSYSHAQITLLNIQGQEVQVLAVQRQNFPKYFRRPIEQGETHFDNDFYSLKLPTPIQISGLPESEVVYFPSQTFMIDSLSTSLPKIYVGAYPSKTFTNLSVQVKIDLQTLQEDLKKPFFSIVELTNFSELPESTPRRNDREEPGFFSKVFSFLIPCARDRHEYDEGPVFDYNVHEKKKFASCSPGASKCAGQTLKGMSGGITVAVNRIRNKLQFMVVGIHVGADIQGRTVITRRYDLNWID